MNYKLSRKQAFTVVTGLIVLLALLTIYPLRMWTRDVSVCTDVEQAGTTEVITPGTAAGEFFLATGTHLKSLSFYIDSVESGSKADVLLYSVDPDTGAVKLEARERVTLPENSGWMSAPMDVDTVPGNQYMAFVTTGTTGLTRGLDDNSGQGTFRVGMQVPTEENIKTLQYSFMHTLDADGELKNYHGGEDVNTGIEGYFLMLSLVYTEPISGKTSAALALGIALLGAALLLLGRRFFGKPERNVDVTVQKILQWTVTPLLMVFTLYFLFLIARGTFDYRITDNLLYGAGFLLFAGIVLYAIFHKVEEPVTFVLTEEKARSAVMTVLVALLLLYACDYMNGMVEITHTIAERKMAVVIGLLILATFKLPFRAKAGTAESVSAKDPADTGFKNPALNKTVTSKGVMKSDRIMVALLIACGAWLVLFRNTRWWPVALVVLYGLFFVRFRFFEGREKFLKILGDGILLHFVLVVIWCILHRYYLSFLYIRFSMQFHTVTVTAEYLTMVEAVAMTRFVLKCMDCRGKSFRDVIRNIWIEAILFGTATVYLIFTMSRTGAAATVVMAFLVFLAVMLVEIRAKRGKLLLRLAGTVMGCILSIAVTFPVVFTLQRVIPAVVGEPYLFEIEDQYPEEVLRGDHLDSMYYICIERFDQLFASKMLGMPEQEYDYWKTYLETHPEIDPLTTSYADYYGGRDENGNIRWIRFDPETGDPIDVTTSEDVGVEISTSEDVAIAISTSEDVEIEAFAEGQAKVSGVSEEQAEVSGVSSEQADEATVSEDIGEVSDESDSSETGDLDAYSNGRTTIWRCYLPNLNLTGHDEMGVPLPNGEIAVHAHNTFIQFAYDFGIIGVILFILVLGIGLIRAFLFYVRGEAKNPADGLVPFAVIAGFMAAGMVEWLFQFSNPATVVLLLAMAPLTVCHKK